MLLLLTTMKVLPLKFPFFTLYLQFQYQQNFYWYLHATAFVGCIIKLKTCQSCHSIILASKTKYPTHINEYQCQTFLHLAGANVTKNKRSTDTENPKKKMFICNLYRNDAMCISKETTVRRKYFGTLEFPSSTRFYGQRSTAVASR